MKLSRTQEQSRRLSQRIVELGGAIPQPWPWAVVRRFKLRGTPARKAIERGDSTNKVEVDGALWNLQLLETVERLEKQQRK